MAQFRQPAIASMGYVDAEIDPAKSYWLEHVHYPWPHTMASVEDTQGRTWQLAYVDLYTGPGNKENAPTLIMLHGRGMNSAYWGQLLDRPLAAGYRIVTIDMPHAGKSLPGNLHLPPTRLLSDARRLIFNLVVGQLGIERAAYLGHSLGGQTLAGYALDYPQHVEKLVLYAPAGIELIHPIWRDGVRLDDPALAESYAAFSAAWSGVPLATMGQTAEAIEQSFYAPLRPGAGTYLEHGDPLGEFIVACRTGVLRGNPAERQRTAEMYAFDVLASFLDSRLEDSNALPYRLPGLSMPTLFTIGLEETIYLLPASHHTHLLRDVISPLHAAVRRLGSPVDFKLYPGGSHLMHVALQETLSRDILQFLQRGRVDGIYQGEVEADSA